MSRIVSAIVALATGSAVFAMGPAHAQVRDAVYRGTVVCEKLPFLPSRLRLSMEVTVTGTDARYTRPVVMKESGVEAGVETGTGKIEGGTISLSGGWNGLMQGFTATYRGSFVRRSARLSGKQVWIYQGRTYDRPCSGAVKRPLAVFLKKQKT